VSAVELILTTDDALRALLSRTRRIAVLGIKTQAQLQQPAYYVPEYLQEAGFEVIPVPVYFPEATMILEQPVYRRLADVPGQIDLVDVFRRPADLERLVDDFLAAKPYAAWFQLGIRHDAVARTLADAGIRVVQDKCLMVEHRRLLG
jgi:predicted CoA-binding protein